MVSITNHIINMLHARDANYAHYLYNYIVLGWVTNFFFGQIYNKSLPRLDPYAHFTNVERDVRRGRERESNEVRGEGST